VLQPLGTLHFIFQVAATHVSDFSLAVKSEVFRWKAQKLKKVGKFKSISTSFSNSKKVSSLYQLQAF